MGMMKTPFIFISVFILVPGWSISYEKPLCERMDINTCRRVGYTYTMLPNRFGHKDQNQVARAIKRWSKILRKRCSPLLGDFLCRVYAPPCISDSDKSHIPCRSVCNKIRKDCRRTMKKMNIKWPSSLKCNKLPKKRCFQGSGSTGSPNPAQRVRIRFVKLKRNKDISRHKTGVCQKIAIPMCKGIGYNFTTFPNMFGHRSQVEAASEVQELAPAVKIGCSSSLNLFLCSMYAPVCTAVGTLPPCRSLCERSKEGCEPLLNKFGFIWPAKYNCSRFPEENNGETCISKPADNHTEMFNVTTSELPTKQMQLITKTFPQADKPQGSRCETLTIPMCSRLDYNFTSFPNYFQHRTQDEAILELNQFIPLVKIQCSSSLEWFLCSLYAPICTEVGVLLPCRSLCRRSFRGCLPVLKKFGFQWPEQFNCSRFPEEGNGQVCIP